MTRCLLDVNVVLAFIDRRHQLHDRAYAWARASPAARWLTSPTVQNGALRIASPPSYPSRIGSTVVVRSVSRDFCARPRHEFCPDPETTFDPGDYPVHVITA